MNTLQTRGLSAGSLFKFLFCGSLIPFFLFGLVCGIAAFFGHEAVTLNGKYVFGLAGLLGGLAIGVILPGIFSAIFWIIIFIGSRIWSLLFGPLNLKFKD